MQIQLSLFRSYRFWIAILIVAAVIAFRLSGLGDILSLETLRTHRTGLTMWVNSNLLLSSAVYVLIYVGAVSFSLPGAVFLTLTGGFLFGAMLGTILTAVGATIGATIVFLFAGFLAGDRIIERIETQNPRLVSGIRDNAWSYLLVLRFVPLFPFFMINLASAVVGIKLPTYVIATFLGILPGTAVYSLSGAGLGQIFDQGGEFSLSSVLTPTVVAALLGLAALSLAAIPLKDKITRPGTSRIQL